jgi:hypothetical protein
MRGVKLASVSKTGLSVSQGWKLIGAVKTAERKVAARYGIADRD